jgi:hypothetical protein
MCQYFVLAYTEPEKSFFISKFVFLVNQRKYYNQPFTIPNQNLPTNIMYKICINYCI